MVRVVFALVCFDHTTLVPVLLGKIHGNRHGTPLVNHIGKRLFRVPVDEELMAVPSDPARRRYRYRWKRPLACFASCALLLVGLAAWFGGGAVMTVAAGGFVLAVALWLLDGLLADLLRGPLRWLAKPFRALASALGVLIVLPFVPGIFLGSFLLELFRVSTRI